ncbi:MAG: alpha/beta hydrolase [Acidimicrobiales bacterium]|nr:alpha/beta hydrolase [Acidimicrobiales bacterium]MCB9372985.1 alpha/beta hydrolase [Microthrixaceae bacterium]
MATTVTAARTGTFAWEGRRLAFEEHGEGDRVLLYLHGILMDSEMNRGLATALAERGHRVVLLDLLGHGRSDKPTHASEYRMDTYALQVAACLDHLGIEEAVIGGVSLGANVSLQVAVRAPSRVTALVLEMPVLEWAVPAAAMLFTPLVLGLHYARPVFRAVAAAAARFPTTPIAALNSAVRGFSVPPDSMASVLHGVLVGPVAPSTDERGQIKAPALVIAHKRDLIHPFSDAENLAEQLPDAELLPARNAAELRLFPERLTDEIATFLDRV